MPDNLDVLITENLRIAMAKPGISQAELASRLGIGKSRMSLIARGKASLDSVELFQVARIFGVTTDWFAREHVPEIQVQAA